MKLLHELRRRQMFRLVGLYIVGAWLVIQVADIAFPTWGIPDSAMRYLFYAALLCFPIALIFGWIFDIQRDGIYRTRKAGPGEIVDVRLRWQDYLILAALSGIGISILFGSVEKIRTEQGAVAAEHFVPVVQQENSVAVLPFDNLDPNPDTGYFSDGIADEILSRLVNSGDLFVISRASSFAFRQSDDSPGTIAAKLGVRYLLRGTVRRDGDLVRITARLIDAQGSHVWSQSFDRKLEQIFAIQSEIADAVAQRVAEEVALTSDTSTARSTDNFEAYSEFLLGKKIFNDRTPEWRLESIELFRNAIALDPGFAPPHAYLSMTLGFFGGAPEDWNEIEIAALTALELDAGMAEAHVAMGLIHEYRHQNIDAAISAYRRAVELDSTLYIANNKLGLTLEREGRIKEASQVLQQGLERDPLNPVLMLNVAYRHASDGEFHRGEQLMLRLLQLPQLPVFAYRHLASFYRNAGKLDESIKWRKHQVLTVFDGTSEFGPQALSSYLFELTTAYLTLGMVSEAQYLMQQVLKAESEIFWRAYRQAVFCSLSHDTGCLEQQLRLTMEHWPEAELSGWRTDVYLARIGRLFIERGDFGQGTELIKEWFDRSSAVPDWIPDSDEGMENLQYLVFGLEESAPDEKVSSVFERASRQIEVETQTFDIRRGNGFMILAVNRWLQGNEKGAMVSVRNAIEYGWINLLTSRHNRLRKELLALPELQNDLTDVALEIERQRARVEAADATGDFHIKVAEGLADQIQLSDDQ